MQLRASTATATATGAASVAAIMRLLGGEKDRESDRGHFPLFGNFWLEDEKKKFPLRESLTNEICIRYNNYNYAEVNEADVD